MFRKYLRGRVCCTTDNCKTNMIAKYPEINVLWVEDEIKLELDGYKTRSMIYL